MKKMSILEWRGCNNIFNVLSASESGSLEEGEFVEHMTC